MSDLIDTPKHKDLIYDIGMHKGEDSSFYLRKGFRVVAFEANPDLIRFCKNRLQEYIDRNQLVIVEGAIVDPETVDTDKKKVRFYKYDEMSVWGTVCDNWAERNAGFGKVPIMIEIDAIDFADVVQTHGMPHYMKIDIEGCDMVCVNALKAFQERPDYISLETEKTSMAQIRLEIETLSGLGYNGFKAVEQSVVSSQSAPYPATEGNYFAQRFEDGASGTFGSELGGKWKSKPEILHQYRSIVLGYYLLDEVMSHWKFRRSRRLRSWLCRFWCRFTDAIIPGWYDTHARHSCVKDGDA